MSYILGISSFYHDSAAALIKDGKILVAFQEERFTRIKHDSNFPENSIKNILNFENISLNEIDKFVFYDKPLTTFERIIETALITSPNSFTQFRKSIPVWIKDKLFLKNNLFKQLKKLDKVINKDDILFSEHHLSHASSAFYPSPFEKAVILTIDGVGEWATTSVSIGNKNKIVIEKEINFPHSIGLLYSAFTYYLGFKVNSGEYKVMGLAPYGKPKFKNIILDNLLNLKSDGSFRLNQKYFDYMGGLKMINKNFCNLFGQNERQPEKELLTQFHMDIASSLQKVTEEVLIRLTRSLYREYKIDNLCMAGGVALNCVANGKINEDQNNFKKIWVQPASGDAGGAIGAALAYYFNELKFKRIVKKPDSMKGSFLGNKFSNDEIEKQLNNFGAHYSKLDEKSLLEKTAYSISQGNVVGWFQGRMEFGPRALGARSILGDPRNKNMQRILNLKIKYRESFRPFAPSVLEEDVHNWFAFNKKSPYMLFVSSVHEKIKTKNYSKKNKLFGIEKLNLVRSKLPAITHVDYSARIQTVSKTENPKYYNLIKEFKRITNVGVLINTSFNVRGEPIVCTPEDAYRCFMRTEMDLLVIGNFFLEKKLQNNLLNKFESFKFDLD